MNHHDEGSAQGGMQAPQNIDAELSVLARIMLSREALADAVEMVQAAWFWRPAHEQIFSAATRLFARGAAADPLSVAEELRRDGQLERCGGLAELHRIVSAGLGAGDMSEHAAVVRDAWLRREIARTSMDATARAVRGEGTAGDILGHVQAEFLRLGDDDSGGQSLLRVGEGLEESLRLVREAGERPEGALTGTPTGFTDLDSLTQGLQPGQLVVIAGRPAMGKALALDTRLPTPTGWTTMGDVRVGDMLLGEDGRPTRVVAATEVMTGRDCFEVEFSDGSVIVADGDHQWLTHTRTSRRRGDTLPGVRTTREIARGVLCGTKEIRYNHSVKVAAPVLLPEADLLVGPYTLGAWLGDGHAAAARITTPDLEVLAQIEAEGYRVTHNQLITYGIRLPERAEIAGRACVVCGTEFTPRTVEVRTCGRTCGGKAKGVGVPAGRPACEDCGASFTGGKGGLCMACYRRHGTLQARLRTIGVLGNKHVPRQYLRASEEQRRALLAGLLDADGYCTKGGTVQFAVVNERLARDVRELVASLGYKPSLSSKPARLYGKDCGTAWTVTFTPPDKVFRLARKAARQRLDVKSSNAHRYITAVRQVESVPVRCVEVDNGSHLYLAGEAFIPTHNSTLGLDLLRATSIRHLMASAFFSLEMSRHEINLRMLSAEARVGLHHLRSGRVEDDDWARLARRMPEVAAAPLFVDDSPDLNLLKIRAKARRMRQQHDLSLVVVDYLQLMRAGAGRFANRQEEVSEISRSLKLLAKELEVPVVALSQLNRGPEQRTDKKPMVSDLRESGAIEQDADIVILLHREDAYNKESPRSGEADLIVAKHRNGPTAVITVAFQGHYSRFMDMAQA